MNKIQSNRRENCCRLSVPFTGLDKNTRLRHDPWEILRRDACVAAQVAVRKPSVATRVAKGVCRGALNASQRFGNLTDYVIQLKSCWEWKR
jgi:hypothetical protein